MSDFENFQHSNVGGNFDDFERLDNYPIHEQAKSDDSETSGSPLDDDVRHFGQSNVTGLHSTDRPLVTPGTDPSHTMSFTPHHQQPPPIAICPISTPETVEIHLTPDPEENRAAEPFISITSASSVTTTSTPASGANTVRGGFQEEDEEEEEDDREEADQYAGDVVVEKNRYADLDQFGHGDEFLPQLGPRPSAPEPEPSLLDSYNDIAPGQHHPVVEEIPEVRPDLVNLEMSTSDRDTFQDKGEGVAFDLKDIDRNLKEDLKQNKYQEEVEEEEKKDDDFGVLEKVERAVESTLVETLNFDKIESKVSFVSETAPKTDDVSDKEEFREKRQTPDKDTTKQVSNVEGIDFSGSKMEEVQPEETQNTCTCSPCAWFNPSKLNPKVADLVYWRDVKKTGVVFGVSLITLLSLSCCSFISVISYLLLAVIVGTLSFRIYKSVLQVVQKTDNGHPFKEYLERDLSLPKDKVQAATDLIIRHVECTANQLRRLFLVEDLVASLKFAVMLWCFTYIGAWFNGLTLFIMAFVALFTLPKIYETYQPQIDHYVDIVASQIREHVNKIKAKIPVGKKPKQQ